jgi:hypothetical protein
MSLSFDFHGATLTAPLDIFPISNDTTARSRYVADVGLAFVAHFADCAELKELCESALNAYTGHLHANGIPSDTYVSSTYSFLARSRASVPSFPT